MGFGTTIGSIFLLVDNSRVEPTLNLGVRETRHKTSGYGIIATPKVGSVIINTSSRIFCSPSTWVLVLPHDVLLHE